MLKNLILVWQRPVSTKKKRWIPHGLIYRVFTNFSFSW